MNYFELRRERRSRAYGEADLDMVATDTCSFGVVETPSYYLMSPGMLSMVDILCAEARALCEMAAPIPMILGKVVSARTVS